MKSNLRYGAATHTGRVRPMNEDSFYAGKLQRTDGRTIHLLAVADGIGGYQGGETASKLAIDSSLQLLLDHQAEWPEPGAVEAWPAFMQRGLRVVNEIILQAARENPLYKAMGTTFTAAIETDGYLYMIHIGDSRLYHGSEGTLYQISADHSWAAELARSGQISPQEAKLHPNRNVLTQSLGYDGKMTAQTTVLELLEDSRLMLCSDGLYNMVSDMELEQAVLQMHDPQQTAEALLQKANQQGGVDNITVITALYRAEERGEQP